MSAKFYYYPEPNGSHLVEIDLLEDLGEMYEDMIIESVDAVSMNGGRSRSISKMGEVITIQRDRLIGGIDTYYKLKTMQNHLDRGFSVSFTADHTKKWIYPILGSPSAGSFSLNVGMDPFRNMHISNISNIQIDDHFVIESAPEPDLLQEMGKAAGVSISASGGSITLNDRLAFDYSNYRAFVRWFRYYPVLKRPQEDLGKSIVTNENGRLFSLNLRLVPDYSNLFAFHPRGANNEDIGLGSSLIRESPSSGTLPNRSGSLGLDGIGSKFRNSNTNIEKPNINSGIDWSS